MGFQLALTRCFARRWSLRMLLSTLPNPIPRDGRTEPAAASNLATSEAEPSLRSPVAASEILASISAGIVVLSPTWKFLYLNSAAAEVLGVRDADVVGQDHWELFPHLRGSPVEAAYREALANSKRVEVDHWCRRVERWVRVEVHPGPRGLTLLLTDVTEQKASLAIQQVNENRFRLATSNRFLMLYEQDRDLRYTWLFPNHPEHRDALGKTDEELQPGELGQRVSELKREVMDTGVEIRREVESRVGDTSRFYDLFVSPRLGPSGAIVGVCGAALDITHRKHAEQSLSRSEERFRATYDHAPVGIAEANLSGTMIAANTKFCTQLGFTREELIGRSILEITHPDDIATTTANYTELVQGRVPFYASEKRHRHKDGHYIWVSVTVSLVRNENGTGPFGVAIVEDITEKKRADDARRRLAAIVESSEDAIVAKDLDCRIQSWNRGAERLFGYTAAEMVGQPISRIIPPERRNEDVALAHRIKSTKAQAQYETVRLHKDGHRLDVALTIAPIFDAAGEVVGVSKIARDITEKKKAAIHQHLLYNLVARVNRADAIEDIYEAALSALCHSQNARRASILLFDSSGKMRFSAWRGLSDEYRQAVDGHSPWQQGETGAQPICIENVGTVTLDAELRTAVEREGIRALTFIPLTYENELLGKFMVYFDVPQSHLAENLRVAETIARQVGIAIARRRAAYALEALVESRTASLQDAIQQMEEFSYSVSHDLRAPIRAMIGYSDILLGEHGETLDDNVREFLQRILKNARRMEALVRDTLAYSKLARRELTLAPVPVKRLVDDVIAALDLPAGTSSITCGECSGVVQAHEASLAQALTNLLRNALKFVAPGVAPRVNVQCENRGQRVRLWVEDNGIGIRPELHARLFGMFERLHVERSYEGTGIGLAIVRKAIERMGGTVGVESDGTNGSRFWIELPGVLTSGEN